MLRRASLVFAVSLLGCAGGQFPPGAPDDAKTRQLFGTAKNDLWRHWEEPTGNQGQPIPHFFKHFDGSSSVSVTVPEIFTQNACGKPQAITPGERGQLWLASNYLWACGRGTGEPPASRIILGTLSRDGTWADRSSALPSLASPGSYDRVELFSSYGIVILKVGVTSPAGQRTTDYYRLSPTAVTPLGSYENGSVYFFDKDRVYLGGGVNLSLTHQLTGDAFVALPTPIAFPGGLLARGGAEIWAWNANDVIQQTQNRVAYRFDGAQFQRIDFTTADKGESGATWQAIALVPRGNGKATLLGQLVQLDIYARSTHTLTARQLTGTTLSADQTVFGPVECATGENDSGEACSRIKAGVAMTLDDGTIVVTASSYADKPYTLSLIDPARIPQ